MKKRILFIFNPVSGQSQIRSSLMDILEILTEDGSEVICSPTRKKGDAYRSVLGRGRDCGMIVCAGGDGTLDEVVNGMMEAKDLPVIPIGFIPCGSTNDFAASIGIPFDLEEAARITKSGHIRNLDIGFIRGDSGKTKERISQQHFVYVAAFGLFTEVSYGTPQDLKNAFGHMAYLIQGVQELGNLKTYHISVESDELTISDDFLFGMISNSQSVGGFSNITGTDVDLDDGVFEVTLIKEPRNILEISDILQILNRSKAESELVYQFRTKHITLKSEKKLSWTLDGEYGGAFRKSEISVLPGKMKFISPGTDR